MKNTTSNGDRHNGGNEGNEDNYGPDEARQAAAAREAEVRSNFDWLGREGAGPDIYVAGWEWETGWGDPRATLWKNRAVQRLCNGNSRAYSVHVSGEDVYAAGCVWLNDCLKDHAARAALWKNGVLSLLANVESKAWSVFVSGGDVYVAGTKSFRDRACPTLWKNGAPQRLGSVKGSGARSVCVSDGDVYVAGWEGDNEPATLWKNGVAQRLGDDSDSAAMSVCVSGKDVYTAGYVWLNNHRGPDGHCGHATFWKNGAAQRLGNGFSYAQSVCVSGGDVYIAGTEDTQYGWARATLWKNGAASRVSGQARDPLGAFTSHATSLFVSGDDVYVTGCEDYGEADFFDLVWKNGAPLRLGNKDSHAESIFVAERSAVHPAAIG